MTALVSAVFSSPATPVKLPQHQTLDTRFPENVAVEDFGDVVVVSNFDLVWNLLLRCAEVEPSIWASLGSPDQWMAFFHMDSGWSYGYAIYKGDRLIRSRLQTTDLPDMPPLVEWGEPLPLEKEWLNAPWSMEVDDPDEPEDQVKVFRRPGTGAETTEEGLTVTMLRELSTQLWGMCPWDWTTRPRVHYFEIALPNP